MRYLIEVDLPAEADEGMHGFSAATVIRKHMEKALREAWSARVFPTDPAGWIVAVRKAEQ